MREAMLVRWRAGRDLRDERSLIGDPFVQLPVARGITVIDPSGENGHGQPVLDRPEVRARIDPARQPADDAEPGAREVGRETPSDLLPIVRRRTRPDD